MKTTEISISVLMTSYNREKYIGEAIDSVLASTFRNFELIIVDDASTDSTVDIAKKYELLDSRVKVYVNSKNLGDYPNRNRAASYANGKYIKYVDSDDFIYPHSLSIMFDSMERHHGLLGLCCGNYPFSYLPVYLNPRESFIQHFLHGGLFGRSPLSAIIRLDFFNSVGKFNEERMVSDFEFFFRVGFQYGVLCIQDGLGWNRLHDGQEIKDARKFQKRYFEIEYGYLKNTESPLSKLEVRKIENSRKNSIFIRLKRKILK
jgi:glycosyltransferase involved in cell wall biosynthesis